MIDPRPWGVRTLATGKSTARDLKLVRTRNDHLERVLLPEEDQTDLRSLGVKRMKETGGGK